VTATAVTATGGVAAARAAVVLACCGCGRLLLGECRRSLLCREGGCCCRSSCCCGPRRRCLCRRSSCSGFFCLPLQARGPGGCEVLCGPAQHGELCVEVQLVRVDRGNLAGLGVDGGNGRVLCFRRGLQLHLLVIKCCIRGVLCRGLRILCRRHRGDDGLFVTGQRRQCRGAGEERSW